MRQAPTAPFRSRPTLRRSIPGKAIRPAGFLLAIGVVVASLAPAIGEGSATVDLSLSCEQATVGVPTACVATLTETVDPGSNFPVRIGVYDNEQGGRPTRVEAVARARQFDVITAGVYQYREHVAAMKAANPALVLNVYANGTHTRSTTLPEGQYCLDGAGDRITTTGLWSGNILMNPAHAGWRATLLDQVKTSLQTSGYDGAFLDVLGRGSLLFGVTGRCIDPRTGREYTPADWERDTSALAGYIREQTHRDVVANGASRGQIYFGSPASAVIAAGVDGGLAEGFTRYGATFDGFYSEGQIVKDLEMVGDAPSMGVLAKDWRDVSAATKDQAMRYAFAVFLLGTNGNDVFGWTGSKHTMTAFHPLWDTDLGDPRGEAYALGSGRYRRNFARGFVSIDTVAHAGYVHLNSTDTHAVGWSSSGGGTFEGATCARADNRTTRCEVRYVPASGSAGDHTITATYAGTASSVEPASVNLHVRRRATVTEVGCISPVELPAAVSTCTITVRDTGGGTTLSPTGAVTLTGIGDGAIEPSCTLEPSAPSASRCATTYVPKAPGAHTVTAAYGGDRDHDGSEGSSSIDVQSGPAPDVEPPTLMVTSPTDGSTIEKNQRFTITADASDESGLAGVAFVVNGKMACDRKSGPWTCAWISPRGANKPVTIVVTASDTAGNATTATVTLTTLP